MRNDAVPLSTLSLSLSVSFIHSVAERLIVTVNGECVLQKRLRRRIQLIKNCGNRNLDSDSSFIRTLKLVSVHLHSSPLYRKIICTFFSVFWKDFCWLVELTALRLKFWFFFSSHKNWETFLLLALQCLDVATKKDIHRKSMNFIDSMKNDYAMRHRRIVN